MSVELERPRPIQKDPDVIKFAELTTWYGVPVTEMDREELLMMIGRLMQDVQRRREEEQMRRAMPVGQYL